MEYDLFRCENCGSDEFDLSETGEFDSCVGLSDLGEIVYQTQRRSNKVTCWIYRCHACNSEIIVDEINGVVRNKKDEDTNV